MILPSRVRRGKFKGCGEARRTVLSPMTTWLAKGAKLIGVPSTLIADSPGLNVFPPITNCENRFAVTGLDPTVITGRVAGCFKGRSARSGPLNSSWTGRTGVGLGEFGSGLPERLASRLFQC